MKKLLLIFICALLVCAILPTAVFAEDNSQQAKDIYFISPVGIAVIGDNLLVADNVADNRSAVLCFDLSSNNAHNFTYLFDKQAKNISVSNGRLFVIFADSFAEYTITQNQKGLTLVGQYNHPNVIDVCVGNLKSHDNTIYNDVIYFIQKDTKTDDCALKYIFNGNVLNINGMLNSAYTSCISVTDSENNFIYVAGVKNDENVIQRYCNDPNFTIATDPFNQKGISQLNATLLGIAQNGAEVPIVYGENFAHIISEDGAVGNETFTANPFFNYQSDYKIEEILFEQNKLILLNSNQQIVVYNVTSDSSGYNIPSSPNSLIGSDTVSLVVPDNYTGFVRAKSNGYPTNIIYKTQGENSIESILTKQNVVEFIILYYEGASQSNYYYVMVEGKFGWVKKSDTATITMEKGNVTVSDDKIDVLDSTVSGDIAFLGDIKFNSMGIVYVYGLPSEQSSYVPVQQSTTSQLKVKVLQQFRQEEKLWYFVEYGEGQRGFVMSHQVGNIKANATVEISGVEDKQINASLFNAVTLHMTSDLNDESIVVSATGEQIKLYSGRLVKVVKRENNACLIQVVENDGSVTYGWVSEQRLTGVENLTINEIVGLSALGFAFLLTIIFVTVFFKRKKQQM